MSRALSAERVGRRRVRRSGRVAASITGMTLLAPATLLLAQAPHYTSDQADRGRAEYLRSCAACHGPNLTDGAFGPPLAGVDFRQRWAGLAVAELYDRTRETMPPDRAGTLRRDVYAELIAFVLARNGFDAGTAPLPSDAGALTALKMPGRPSSQQGLRAGGPGGGLAPGVALPFWPTRENPLETISPVTEALLADPPAGEWLTWRRDYRATGFSPLDQIDAGNVAELELAWTLTLPPGPNEATPLVHDGVIFTHSFGDHVHALDAASGDELWHYQHPLPDDVPPTVKRNIALYGERVYVATSDLHVVALDYRTGEVVWDEPIGELDDEWRLTGGPLVAAGKVMTGLVGRGAGGPYLAAQDAETGALAWRFHSIARPGSPGGDSWNGLPLEARNGGSIWTAGSYDPALGLVYFGPAQTYDTGPLRYPVEQPGITNDALFTNTTLAIDPATGERVWHYQHHRNDQWDLDWAFERQIVELTIFGQRRKVVVTGGKPGLHDVLDAATGDYLTSFDMGLQNVFLDVDPETGEKTINEDLLPGDGKVELVCPHAGGGRSWLPSAINPRSGRVFIPAVESCMDLIPVADGERGSLSTGVRWALRPRPDSDGRYGRIQALDVATGETLWNARQRAPQSTGVLATGGGVIFAGALDRKLTAYDAASGEVLWSAPLSDVPNSNPISYAVDGRQHIAIVVGYGGAQVATFPVLTPEITLPSVRSSAIFVFALPR
jgi:alcohol dehydrogenase (cytochrome c)